MRNAPRTYSIPAGVLTAGRNVVAVRISNVNGRGGFVPDPTAAPALGVNPVASTTPTGQALTGMVIAGDGFTVPLSGEWRAKVEEAWDGARRREVATTSPIAQQFLLANSPVADMFRPAAPAPVAAAAPTAAPASAGGDVTRIALGVIPGQMKFDKTLLTVRPGSKVEITLVNTDDMPHNFVLFKRGSMERR
jgi:plastocyanin